MARTSKPCPGCGQVDRYRPADKVCWQCREKLEKIAEIEAEAVRIRSTVANTLSVKTEPHTIFLPDRCYMVGGTNDTMYDAPEYRTFTLSTAAVIKALTQPLDRGRQPPEYSRSHGSVPVACDFHLSEVSASKRGFVEASDLAVTTMREWWKDVGVFARACYTAGVNDGRDLLGQLASGEMTLAQVNDRALAMTRKR